MCNSSENQRNEQRCRCIIKNSTEYRKSYILRKLIVYICMYFMTRLANIVAHAGKWKSTWANRYIRLISRTNIVDRRLLTHDPISCAWSWYYCTVYEITSAPGKDMQCFNVKFNVTHSRSFLFSYIFCLTSH